MDKKKIVIITDSTAYIPENALTGLDVAVIPQWLLWEGESFRDGIDIQPSTFYQRLRETKTLPTTSQPAASEFVNFYQEMAQNADAMISVLVSGKISGTIASAEAAMKQLHELDIHIVDSYSCSMGLGFIVLAAARAAADGKDVTDVIAAAEQMRARVNLIFVVDTLEYLHKGGRIGGAKRLLGTALQVKPLLQFEEGQIEPLDQVRTKNKAYARLIQIADERLDGKTMAEAAVVDVDSPADGENVAQMVKERFHPRAIYRSGVSPVVGTHVGPGTIGLAFYAEEEDKT